VKAGDAEALRALLAADPELASARENGVSAVLVALYHRRPEARDALLEAGAEVGPLEAAALGDLARLQVDARGGDGFTPLHLAAFFGGAEAVREILATGADPDADADNPFKVRPLHSACARGDVDCARALLEAGANPNLAQQHGYTPLHSAAHLDATELASLLLEHGADRLAKNDEGKLPYDLSGDAAVRKLLSP
jgi:ankyrin repeat protein